MTAGCERSTGWKLRRALSVLIRKEALYCSIDTDRSYLPLVCRRLKGSLSASDGERFGPLEGIRSAAVQHLRRLLRRVYGNNKDNYYLQGRRQSPCMRDDAGGMVVGKLGRRLALEKIIFSAYMVDGGWRGRLGDSRLGGQSQAIKLCMTACSWPWSCALYDTRWRSSVQAILVHCGEWAHKLDCCAMRWPASKPAGRRRRERHKTGGGKRKWRSAANCASAISASKIRDLKRCRWLPSLGELDSVSGMSSCHIHSSITSAKDTTNPP